MKNRDFSSSCIPLLLAVQGNEIYTHQITEKWDIDLSAISNQGKKEKRFDFVVKTPDTIDGFTFVWFTDGKGWTSARHNLEETFDVMEHVYSIDDMENRIMKKIFKQEVHK